MLKSWQIKKLESIKNWDQYISEERSVDKNKRELLEMAKRGEQRPSCHKHKLGSALVAYTNKSTSYDEIFDTEIRQLIPKWFENSVLIKQNLLIQMALNGEERPNQKKHKLGVALTNYTLKSSDTFDSKFNKKIRILAPKWFEDTVAENKSLLFKMARKGLSRPHINDNRRLSVALVSYTSKGHASYSSQFSEEIRNMAPKWFEDTAAQKKKTLLEMAKHGESKPLHGKNKHPLAEALHSYLNKTHGSYDDKFDKEIHKLAPNWFEDTAFLKKQMLLEMAKRGESKPIYRKHPLGIPLACYISKKSGCYDVQFEQDIHKAAPCWFVKAVVENKSILLKLAMNGKSRPSSKTKIGDRLNSYVNKHSKCFDFKFDREIRTLAPKWFVDTAVENKKALLGMVKRGEPRPVQKKHPLADVFSSYIRKDHGSYDAEFDKEIRKIAPHWFKNRSANAAKNKRLLLCIARRGGMRPNSKKDVLGTRLVCYTSSKSSSYDSVFDKEIRTLVPYWFTR